MKIVYEEYSKDRNAKFIICEAENYYLIKAERYYDEVDIEGYIEPAGFREVRDGMIYHVGTIEEGIPVGRELLKNL